MGTRECFGIAYLYRVGHITLITSLMKIYLKWISKDEPILVGFMSATAEMIVDDSPTEITNCQLFSIGLGIFQVNFIW